MNYYSSSRRRLALPPSRLCGEWPPHLCPPAPRAAAAHPGGWGRPQARRKLEKGRCPGLALLPQVWACRPPHLAPLAESQSSRKERSAPKTEQVPALFGGKSQAPPSLCRFVLLGEEVLGVTPPGSARSRDACQGPRGR